MERLNPSGQEGIRPNLHTIWKLKPSGKDGRRHKCTYKMEAEALRARGDMAQIYIQNGS